MITLDVSFSAMMNKRRPTSHNQSGILNICTVGRCCEPDIIPYSSMANDRNEHRANYHSDSEHIIIDTVYNRRTVTVAAVGKINNNEIVETMEYDFNCRTGEKSDNKVEGILLAMEIIARNQYFKKFTIFCNSSRAIENLKNKSNRTGREIINKMKYFRAQGIWIEICSFVEH